MLYGPYSLEQVRHALAQFAFDAAAFLFAHFIQAIEYLANSCHHRRLEHSIFKSGSGVERTWNAENYVEIRLGGHGKLACRSPKRRDVSADQRTIQREGIAVGALQIQGHLDVAARDFFFEQTAEVHFERV